MGEAPGKYEDGREDGTSGPVLCGQDRVRVAVKASGVKCICSRLTGRRSCGKGEIAATSPVKVHRPKRGTDRAYRGIVDGGKGG